MRPQITFPAAVSATNKRDTLSDAYSFIPTTEVIDVLASKGWHPVAAHAVKPRQAENALTVKHSIDFEHDTLSDIGESERFRVKVLNSHNGLSSFQFFTGVFRTLCANGLIAGLAVPQFKVRHVGFTHDKVLVALEGTLQNTETVVQTIVRMKNAHIGGDQLRAIAGTVRETLETNYDFNTLFRARRYQDATTDVWATFNRVQENIIKGGAQALIIDKDGRPQLRTQRAIKSIDRQIKVNRVLWDLFEREAA
jgi:hypothetical protein